jgi:hypothetical protein
VLIIGVDIAFSRANQKVFDVFNKIGLLKFKQINFYRPLTEQIESYDAVFKQT